MVVATMKTEMTVMVRIMSSMVKMVTVMTGW